MSDQRTTLAWHETLETHELVAFQSIGLIKLKKAVQDGIQDKELEDIYLKTIDELDMNLRELLALYSIAPKPGNSYEYRNNEESFLAGDLLAFSKSAVRNYGIAITETATPSLREIFKRQINKAINCHERIFTYMYKKGLYPAYDLNKMLQNDINLAKKALSL